MKEIERLIIKAHKLKNYGGLRVYMALILVDDKVSLITRLWNGVSGGKSKEFISYHKSVEDAKTELNILCNKYPNNDDILVIIDDIKGELICQD